MMNQYAIKNETISNQTDVTYYKRKRKILKKTQTNIRMLIFFISAILTCAASMLALYQTRFKNNNFNDNLTVGYDNTIQEKNPDDSNEFSSIYFYESDKFDRYKNYKNNHPDLTNEDVIWQVNSGLDSNWYENTNTVDSYDDPYIIVNKYSRVPDGYRPPDLEKFDGQLLRKETGDAYIKMRNAAAKEGYKITAVSGYRTVDYQRNLYNKYLKTDSMEEVDRYSARAGHSEHHTGMALDIFGSKSGLNAFGSTPEYQWLLENGYKYGFIIRYWTDIEKYTGYKDEPWHIRYVGAEVSTDMYNKDIKCYEEYYVKYIKHKPN